MKWISVKDELPNDKQVVLVCGPYEGGTIISMYLFRKSHKPFWYSIPAIDLEEVTHWMTLPKPPSEKNEV